MKLYASHQHRICLDHYLFCLFTILVSSIICCWSSSALSIYQLWLTGRGPCKVFSMTSKNWYVLWFLYPICCKNYDGYIGMRKKPHISFIHLVCIRCCQDIILYSIKCRIMNAWWIENYMEESCSDVISGTTCYLPEYTEETHEKKQQSGQVVSESKSTTHPIITFGGKVYKLVQILRI